MTNADVNRYPTGSPSHALLVWWRSAQFANLGPFLDGFERSVRRTLAASPKTVDALTYFAGAIRTVRPRIVSVSQKAGTATVYTMLEYRRPLGTKRYVVDSVPRAFDMVRQDGSWRLRDDGFLQTTLAPNLRRPQASAAQRVSQLPS